jgi:hypothetical protein
MKISHINDVLDDKNISKNDILILNPRDKNFNKHLQIAYYFKFENPIIRREKKIKNSNLLLSKRSEIESNEVSRDASFFTGKEKEKKDQVIPQQDYNIFINRINFALKSYKTSRKICKNYILLTDNTIKLLRFHTEEKKIKSKNGNMEQREISGLFDIYPISDNMLEVEIDENKVNTGELESANHTNTVGSFHTHPLDAYIKYNVCMAFPSADDYFTTLYVYASGYGVFHIVSGIEGIYIITVKKSFMPQDKKEILKNFDKYKDDIEEKYGVDYPICDPKANNHKFWKKYIEKYLRKINRLKYFKLQFVFWKDAHKPIEITYPKINNNCLISDNQINIMNKINI